jgi:hypothetical protein
MRIKRRTSEGTGMWVLLLVAIGVFVLMLMAGGTQEPRPHAKTMDKLEAPATDIDSDPVLAAFKRNLTKMQKEYDTIYHVKIAGHEFEIAGNKKTGTFGWTANPKNECFATFVARPSRVGIVHVKFNSGPTLKMMAFDNFGRGHCGSLALLLYLCALGIEKDLLGELPLITQLRSYIELHMDDNDGMYRDFFATIQKTKNVNAIEQCSMEGGGLTMAHYHAFAHQFNVPVRLIKMDYDKAMVDPTLRGELGDLSSAVYSRLGVAKEEGVNLPPGWEDTNEFDPRICNILSLDVNPEFSHAVLLGYIAAEESKRSSFI